MGMFAKNFLVVIFGFRKNWDVTSPMAGLSGVESWIVCGSRFSSPENRQEHQIALFTAKSKPTAPIFEPMDHKAVGELPLSDHHPIWSQSSGNWMNAKNTGFSSPKLESSQSMNLWGIRWNPSVERINSRPSPSQIKKKSKCSQIEEPRQEQSGKNKNAKNTNVNHKSISQIKSRRTRGG
jgi:hypothetical protein